MRSSLVVVATSLLLAVAPLLAHHSFAAEYDSNKAITLQGTVTKIEWMNPHIWMYLDSKDQSGGAMRWQCEGGAPNSLVRQGWTRNSLKIGDVVTIEGFRAKDGTNTCNSRSVKLPGGKSVFAGSADDGGPEGRRPKE